MFTVPASQKSLFDIAQVATNAAKEITQANLQFVNTATKAYFDACLTCCKLGEESTQQVAKATTTGKA